MELGKVAKNWARPAALLAFNPTFCIAQLKIDSEVESTSVFHTIGPQHGMVQKGYHCSIKSIKSQDLQGISQVDRNTV